MVKRKHPCVYKEKNRNTYFVKKNYVDPLGKSQTLFKRGFSSLKEAKDYLDDFLVNHKNDCTMPLAGVINSYLKYCEHEKTLKPSTLKTRTCIITTHILPYFADMPINKINQRDIIAWHQQIKRDHPNLAETYKYEISKTLIFIFKFAVNILDLKNNVAEKCGCIGHARVKRDIYWTLDEYNTFIDTLRDEQLVASNHIRRKVDTDILIAAFNVLFYTGLRISELMGLTLDSINLDHKTLTVNKQYQDKNLLNLKPRRAIVRSRSAISYMMTCASLSIDWLMTILINACSNRSIPLISVALSTLAQNWLELSASACMICATAAPPCSSHVELQPSKHKNIWDIAKLQLLRIIMDMYTMRT